MTSAGRVMPIPNAGSFEAGTACANWRHRYNSWSFIRAEPVRYWAGISPSMQKRYRLKPYRSLLYRAQQVQKSPPCQTSWQYQRKIVFMAALDTWLLGMAYLAMFERGHIDKFGTVLTRVARVAGHAHVCLRSPELGVVLTSWPLFLPARMTPRMSRFLLPMMMAEGPIIGQYPGLFARATLKILCRGR